MAKMISMKIDTRDNRPNLHFYKPNGWVSSDNKLESKPEKRAISSTSWSLKPDSIQDADERDRPSPNNSFLVFRLPKLDLTPFDGDSKTCANFIAIFKDLVNNNSSISTKQKMAILKQCLTQDIRDGLGDSLSSPALYDKALRELEQTYGHPRLVSKSHIQSLINLPKVNINDYKALLKASQQINGSVASLRNGGYHVELHSLH